MNTNPIMERLISGLECNRDTAANGMRKRVFTIIDVTGVIHANSVEFVEQMTGETKFLYANVRGVDVHLRDGLESNNGLIQGRIDLKVRTWERADGNGWRNYQFYVNVYPSTDEPTCELVIHDPTAPRAHRDMDGDRAMFAHVSSDNKRSHFVQVLPLNAETETPDRRPRRKPAMAEALQAASVVVTINAENSSDGKDHTFVAHAPTDQ